jgi:hypothetical protein
MLEVTKHSIAVRKERGGSVDGGETYMPLRCSVTGTSVTVGQGVSLDGTAECGRFISVQ